MAGNTFDLTRLHDATLISVTVDWGGATAEFSLRLSSIAVEGLRIVGEGLKHLTLPRKNEWGESVSVNSATIESLPDGVRLKVEMQSGDVIDVVARNFKFIQPA